MALRDLAMREALGLLDEDEAARFESAFLLMTPDDQAAMLDLQAAVAREIAGGGTEEPDRALRYKVLARLTEDMASDLSASGPIAVIGSARSGVRRSSTGGADSNATRPVTELQFQRVSRSAAVWRAASFALAAAAITLGLLNFEGQRSVQRLLDHESDSLVADRLGDLFGEDVDLESFLNSSTAVVHAIGSVSADAAGSGLLFRESRINAAGGMPAVLVGFQFPDDVVSVDVVAVAIDGSGEASLGTFLVAGRTTHAAFPLELGNVSMANVIIEIRDAEDGTPLMRTAVMAV
jgi:hypothetical protein